MNFQNLQYFLIVTEEMMGKLGYSAPYPAYIDRQRYNPESEALGFKVMDGFVRLPLPVLGVVHRLPGNVDLISTKNCYFQDINDNTYLRMVSGTNYVLIIQVERDGSSEDFSCILATL